MTQYSTDFNGEIFYNELVDYMGEDYVVRNLDVRHLDNVVRKVNACSGSVRQLNLCLLDAIKSNDLPLTVALIREGANNFDNALVYAAHYGRENIINVLLKDGLYEYRNFDNARKLAIKYATANNHLSIIALLRSYEL